MQKRFSKRKMIIMALSNAESVRGDDIIEKTISALFIEEDYKNASNESNFVEIYLVKECGYHEKKKRKTKTQLLEIDSFIITMMHIDILLLLLVSIEVTLRNRTPCHEYGFGANLSGRAGLEG